MKKNTVTIICALFVFLFVYTAINKVIEFQSFTHVLMQLPLIGNYASTVALIVPVTECVVAALLLSPYSQKVGLYASLVLMVLFTGYIAYLIAFEKHLPCSCGGVISYMSWRQHLVFNLVWIILGITGLRLIPQKIGNLCNNRE